MCFRFTRRSILLAAGGLLLAGSALGVHFYFSATARTALAGGGRERRPLTFTPLPTPAMQLAHWGSGDVEALAHGPQGLLTAGGFGLSDGKNDLGMGLPTLRVAALALWRGRPVAGLTAGGLFLQRGSTWEEARTGFGLLHVRALLETPGGQLLIGAQEGLFRATWGANTLERLDAEPVRALALGASDLCLAAGEKGLRRVDGTHTSPLPTPDPWVDWVGFLGSDVCVLTPLGLARGPLGGPLQPLTGGAEVRQAVQVGDQVRGVSQGTLLRFEASGRTSEEPIPDAPRRVLTANGQLFADTATGLFRHGVEGWRLIRPRPSSLPPGPSHINALALQGGRVLAGLFDGGLAVAEPGRGGALTWRAFGDATTWGVNALLPAGGTVYVASLRGPARFDGTRLSALPEAANGAAYALAQSREGLAIGYGQGVLLGGNRLISAFHGLPGNQALALLSGDELLVGTPSGLGAIRDGRVSWRVVAGEGRLPHPWVTALAHHKDAIFIGTYGGGMVRRTPSQEPVGSYLPFPETEGLKVNPGCVVEAGGRLFVGTDGRGLYRLSADGQRFLRLELPLPSPRITALLADTDALYVGTDEGLARIPYALLQEGV